MGQLDLLDRFIAEERKLYPKADYRFKGDVLLHKMIAFYLRPFNHRYLDGFTTTVYPNTDFPDRKKSGGYGVVKTEFHENVHKWDRWSEGVRWSLKYAFPQIVALPFIIAAAAIGLLWGLAGLGTLLVLFHLGLLACHLRRDKDGRPHRGAKIAFYALTALGGTAAVAGSIIGGGWLALLWLGVPLFVSPWPFKSVWRRDAELRGYTASLYQEWLRHGSIRKGIIDHYVQNFTGGNYFWMERNAERVHREFQFQITRLQINEKAFLGHWAWRGKRGWASVEQAEPYRMMKSFMAKERLTHGGQG